MFCYTLLYVHSSIAIILMGKRELIALLNLSSWCLVMVVRLFLAVPRGCLQFVIVVFPDHTHLLFLLQYKYCIIIPVFIRRLIFCTDPILSLCTMAHKQVSLADPLLTSRLLSNRNSVISSQQLSIAR